MEIAKLYATIALQGLPKTAQDLRAVEQTARSAERAISSLGPSASTSLGSLMDKVRASRMEFVRAAQAYEILTGTARRNYERSYQGVHMGPLSAPPVVYGMGMPGTAMARAGTGTAVGFGPGPIPLRPGVRGFIGSPPIDVAFRERFRALPSSMNFLPPPGVRGFLPGGVMDVRGGAMMMRGGPPPLPPFGTGSYHGPGGPFYGSYQGGWVPRGGGGGMFGGIGGGMAAFGGGAARFGGGLGAGFLGGGMGMLGAGMMGGPSALTGAAAGAALKESLNTARDWELGLVKIGHAAEMTKDELQELQKELIKLSNTMPTSVPELQMIAKEAAQMNITGKKNIMDFVKPIAMFANVTGMQPETVGENIGFLQNLFHKKPGDTMAMASVIKAVADQAITTPEKLLTTFRYAGGAMALAKVPFEQSAAIAGMAAEAGISPEVFGSAMMRLTQRATKDPAKFAAALGMDEEEFRAEFQRDPGAVFQKFFKSFKGKDAFQAQAQLEEFGAGVELRHSAAFIKLAEVTDKWAASIKTAADEMQRVVQGGEKVSKLFGQQAEETGTVAGQEGLAMNRIEALKERVGKNNFLQRKWREFLLGVQVITSEDVGLGAALTGTGAFAPKVPMHHMTPGVFAQRASKDAAAQQYLQEELGLFQGQQEQMAGAQRRFQKSGIMQRILGGDIPGGPMIFGGGLVGQGADLFSKFKAGGGMLGLAAKGLGALPGALGIKKEDFFETPEEKAMRKIQEQQELVGNVQSRLAERIQARRGMRTEILGSRDVFSRLQGAGTEETVEQVIKEQKKIQEDQKKLLEEIKSILSQQDNNILTIN